jgi:alkanesulfonate monooxygenase SsuD/methylene tetrahydromethanopterin reductase-like flavin-dependent oxidoreductase (luciferase family)
MGFVPGRLEHYRPWVEEGFRRAGGAKGWDTFEIQPQVAVILTDDGAEDVKTALARLKPNIALYVGGMGHASLNFHNQQMTQRGYGDAAARIQELYLSGRKDEAVDAVPDEFVDEGALIGPPDRIRTRYKAWSESGATGLTVSTSQPAAVELMAELATAMPAVGVT